MKVSKKFLNDYIDISNISTKEIADKMLLAGNEYESIKTLGNIKNLVIGKVLEKIKHPDSDHLSICTVDVGDETLQIVCGAPNVDKNQKVIVAKVGATLPGDFLIKETTIRGVSSNGMICSLNELGIDNKYLKEEDINGIHVLSEDAPLGNDPFTYLGLDDEIIDFELTADRSDLLSIIGMAYEVGAIYDLDVKYPDINLTEENINIEDYHSLKVETKNSESYLLKRVNNIVIKESPSFIKNRLISSGIRPINNVVDISNYVMLETGQPLHFFDADKIGKEIIVRMANDNEKIITLDNKERTLNKDDIVITDGKNPVALAGVMGDLSTEVTTSTKNILIESAHFNSTNIRNTSKRVLRSEASLRFEKGINLEMIDFAIKRAAYLLSKYASGKVLKGSLKHNVKEKRNIKINLNINKVNNLLGINLSTDEITKVFDKLKFTYTIDNNYILVNVPERRLDLNIEEDLIEEIGRIIGYDNVPSTLPKLSLKQGKGNIKIKDLKNRLKSFGLNEVITYSLVSEKEINLFNNEKRELVKTLKPISKDKSIMRTSLVPSLINVYNYNKARNIDNINIFEIGSIYYKENNNFIEETYLTVLLSGKQIDNLWQNINTKTDFYLTKGILENILNYIGLNNRYSLSEENLKDMHPGRSASIKIGNESIGYFGEINPDINEDEVYIINLNLDKIFKQKVRGIKFKEISIYPSITKDVAFVVDKDLKSEEIVKKIEKTGKPLLTNIDVFDIYVGENVDKDKKSIAYTLTFSDNTRTLTEKEVLDIFNKIITEVETKLNATVRDS